MLCVVLALLPFLQTQAQIYADISLSQGGTSLGSFRILLEHEKAPRTVANFVGLAMGTRAWLDPQNGAVQENKPYYDGLIFHRLIHSFVLQGGDPLGTGTGGPGYIFQDEFDDSLRHSGRYVLSMANSGVNSNGSQFFITFAAATHLDDQHSVFGTVINDATHPNSRALIDSLSSSTNFPTDSNSRPLTPLVMDSVVISGPDLAGFDVNDPAHKLPMVSRHGKRIESRAGADVIVWDRKDRTESPLRVSGNLSSWSLAGNILNMGDLNDAELNVTSVVNAGSTFFSYPVIDYSHTPQLPENIFELGDQVALEMDGGTLTVTFNGAGGGSWVFAPTSGANQSGVVTSAGVPNGSQLLAIPLLGTFVNGSASYARALSAREITIFLDAPVGPYQISALQPSLSFHSDTAGWYRGPVNSNLTLPEPFKGRFTWTPAP